ncbi:hypothetical protein AVEN_34721-1 [Araneus ventricosus]|uniref:Uncharacterized protein n=1 Tax=Araneus ventricosus TaxID=182803 RepID=A0A4Y2AZQ7_ARAVE|nr:hypothetical protein AVEN_34721-1 [Araneus ventricosus]
MDSPTLAETETPEGSSAMMMDFINTDSNSAICASLTQLHHAINEAKIKMNGTSLSQSLYPDGSHIQNDLKEKFKLLEEEITQTETQVSAIGFCPVTNCAVHCKNINRVSLKRSLASDSDDFPELTKVNISSGKLNRKNDKDYIFPSKRRTAKISVDTNDPDNLNDKIANSNKYATLNSEAIDDGEASQIQPQLRNPLL